MSIFKHSKESQFLDLERMIHSFKTALACLIAYFITRIVKFPASQWIIITVIVVMSAQINVGSVIQRSIMRFLGTFMGSLLGALTLEFSGTHMAATAIVVTLSTLIFSYFATGKSSIKDAGTLGAVTVTIILLGPNPSVSTAAERFLEISAGILIATLVSQFILPIHARRHLRNSQAHTLKQLRDYYCAALVTKEAKTNLADYREFGEAIAKSLITQRSLAKDAAREPLGKPFDPVHFNYFLQCERDIFHSINFMYYATDMLKTTKAILNDIPQVHEFHARALSTLENIQLIVEKGEKVNVVFNLPDLKSLAQAIYAISTPLQRNELTNIRGFLFCAKILYKRLEKLTRLYISAENVLNEPASSN